MTTSDPNGPEPSDYTAPYGYEPPTQPQTPYTPPTYPMPGYAAPQGYPTMPGGYGVDPYGRPLSDKSKVLVGVLQIIPGFGIGRFIMGDNKIGTIQLVVTICTFGLGHIWCIVDGVLILVNGGVDAQGRVLRD